MYLSSYTHKIEKVIVVLKYAQNFENKEGDGNECHYIMP